MGSKNKSWLEELDKPAIEINPAVPPNPGPSATFVIHVVMPEGGKWKRDPQQVAYTIQRTIDSWLRDAVESPHLTIEVKTMAYVDREARKKSVAFDLMMAGGFFNKRKAAEAMKLARGLV